MQFLKSDWAQVLAFVTVVLPAVCYLEFKFLNWMFPNKPVKRGVDATTKR